MRQLMIVSMLAVAALAFAAGDAPLAELGQVATALQPITAMLSPTPEVKTTGPSSLTVSYRTQTFKIHGGSMTGEFAKEAHDEVGPTCKGFVLFVDVQKKGEVNQAKTPQTLRRPYWETYIQVTPVAGSDRQLYWGLSYGSRTDTKLLTQLRQAIEKMKDTPNHAPEDTASNRADSEGSLAAEREWQAEHPEVMKKVEALRKWKEEHPEVMKEIKEFNLHYAVLVKTQEGKAEALDWFKTNRRLWEGSPLEAETLQEVKRLETESK